MVERIKQTPEQQLDNPDLVKEGAERSAELANERERAAAERTGEASVDTLTQAAEKAAERKKPKTEKRTATTEKRRDTPTERKAKARASYKKTMKETQVQMKPTQRAFSKTIHNPVVEKTSEVVGSTVARPNAVLAGSVSAFLFTLALYVIAKHLGYPLSGFETIAAFVLGWAVGLLYDYVRVMVTGKRA